MTSGMTDDPNSVADTPTALPIDVIANEIRVQSGDGYLLMPFSERAEIMVDVLAAAGFEVVPAGTADRLAALTAAIGDPDELRWHRWHCEETGRGDDLRELLVRIADAADAAAVAEGAEDRGQTDG